MLSLEYMLVKRELEARLIAAEKAQRNAEAARAIRSTSEPASEGSLFKALGAFLARI